MLFEGSEKKLEVMVNSESHNLRAWGGDFWARLVNLSGAQILSKMESSHCDAYLLSESSLFVWDHHFTMITCGRTKLVKAALEFLKQVPQEDILSFIFERKNEYFPHHQKSDFFQDCRALNEQLNGEAYRFGQADEHHLFLYHLNKGFNPSPDDFTLEVLMYDLQSPAKETFQVAEQTAESVRDKTGVDRIFQGFKVDDHIFEPCGYSLNALRADDYYTIHVTPQELGSYVSFETNINLGEDVLPTLNQVLEVFRPGTFDVVLFRPCSEKDVPLRLEGFCQKSVVQESLTCGYEVLFSHFYKPAKGVQRAFPIKEIPIV